MYPRERERVRKRRGGRADPGHLVRKSNLDSSKRRHIVISKAIIQPRLQLVFGDGSIRRGKLFWPASTRSALSPDHTRNYMGLKRALQGSNVVDVGACPGTLSNQSSPRRPAYVAEEPLARRRPAPRDQRYRWFDPYLCIMVGYGAGGPRAPQRGGPGHSLGCSG